MSEYRITRNPSDPFEFQVAHHVKNDPNPTPTVHTVHGVTAAWWDALGRAAKLAIMLGRKTRVVAEDGRIYELSVKQVAK